MPLEASRCSGFQISDIDIDIASSSANSVDSSSAGSVLRATRAIETGSAFL